MDMSMLKIYHIDTGVLGKLAINDFTSCKLDLYLKSQSAAILLTDILMFEILKNSHEGQIVQILNILNKTANKVYLNTELIFLHWIELVDYYELTRSKTPSEFKMAYVNSFRNDFEWNDYVNIMFMRTNEMLRENDQWINDWVFGKMISKKSKERNRQPKLVREILNATASNTKPLNLTKYHKFIDGKIDVNKYSEHEKEILDPINDGGFAKFKEDVSEWVERSMLPFEEAINLTDQELHERVFYAEQLLNASDFLTDKSSKEDFLKKMLPKFGQQISINKLIEEELIELRQGSEAKVRGSDPFDILYLFLLPYADLLSCDKNTHNELIQIIRKHSLFVNAQLQKNEDLYQNIMS